MRSHSGCVSHQGILSTPVPFVPWQSGLPFPRYNLTFKYKVKDQGQSLKGIPVSAVSTWTISLVFHIRSSHRLPSYSFHENRAPHSRDTIWPSKFKVKGQCKSNSSRRSIELTHFLSVSHQGIKSTAVPFVPWQSGLPFPRYNMTLKIQGQISRSTVKVKGTLVSVLSSWLISFLFLINWTNHS